MRKFDETICNKVNKTEIKILSEGLRKEFIHIDKWRDILNEFDEVS